MTEQIISQKQCTKCGECKPETLEYFYWRKGRGKFEAECKACQLERKCQYRAANQDKIRERWRQWRAENPDKKHEYDRQYRAKNRDEIRQRRRQWYIENADRVLERERQYRIENRDTVRERDRQYYIENADRIRERQSKYRTENPDKVRERNRQHYATNPEVYFAAARRRRARKANAEGTHTVEDIRLQYRSQNGICWHCSTPVGDDYHVDHLVPLDRGGTNWPNNIVISCPTCNLSKGAKLPHEWNGKLF